VQGEWVSKGPKEEEKFSDNCQRKEKIPVTGGKNNCRKERISETRPPRGMLVSVRTGKSPSWVGGGGGCLLSQNRRPRRVSRGKRLRRGDRTVRNRLENAIYMDTQKDNFFQISFTPKTEMRKIPRRKKKTKSKHLKLLEETAGGEGMAKGVN